MVKAVLHLQNAGPITARIEFAVQVARPAAHLILIAQLFQAMNATELINIVLKKR